MRRQRRNFDFWVNDSFKTRLTGKYVSMNPKAVSEGIVSVSCGRMERGNKTRKARPIIINVPNLSSGRVPINEFH